MSVLSEWDIINELGRGLFIYPFRGREESITGCCLCLTASRYAYRFEVEQNGEKKTKPLEIKTDSESLHQFLIIPQRKTAVVWTNESVLLGNYLCGSIHSKVKLVSKGIGHIGTRVNPNYGGIMAIALHNLSDQDIEIDIGKNDEDYGETIAYLRIYRLSSKSSSSERIDPAGKLKDAIPPGFTPPPELISWLYKKAWRNGDKSALEEILEQSQKYKVAKNELAKKSIRYRFFFKYLPHWDTSIWVQIIIAGVTAINVIVAIVK
ncbi:hypothetical protein [Kamptonema sp. UHCC 0994]|uniref:hypothetical protein n=1 Tax=Kamptonema sp. UHCC 0994 TaxID=3031329 RepID=UPI0023B8B2F8|nr:hypothetical protein [Kamptonema sp. UHCC 0994]MDF0553534.1 hypothetical protein [Kamptonema sp. UHCC 0994]